MKKIILAVLVLCFVFLYGCSGQDEAPQNTLETPQTPNPQEATNLETQENTEEKPQIPNSSTSAQTRSSQDVTDSQIPLWHTILLEDINSGRMYTIEELNDRPILLESFAVWCPKCTQQQRENKKFHKEVGEAVISIGLNTDPNEDESAVLKHTQENEFDWIYSISPPDLTRELINEFGREIVSAPSVPMILICEDGKSYFLDRGFKSVEKLKGSINEKCNQDV